MAIYHSLEEYQRHLDWLIRRFPQAAERGLARGALLIAKEAQLAHLSGPKMARGVGDPDHATLQPRSGLLRGTVTVQYGTRPHPFARVGIFAGPALRYARAHEEGAVILGRPWLRFHTEEGWWKARLVTLPARPFLRSALRAKRKEALQEILDVLIEEMKKRGGT